MKTFSLLAATGPHAEYAEKLMLYGRFVGSWSIVSIWFGPNGERAQANGEWHFDWILGGRGVQDVLFRSGDPPDKSGTTLRCYNAKLDTWSISWMQPCSGEFVNLVGRKVGEAIVQEGSGMEAGRRERWSFNDIKRDSFIWRGEVSLDGGISWRLEQEMTARRQRE